MFKKIFISGLLAISLIFGVSACTNNNTQEKQKQAYTNQADYPAQYKYIKDFEQLGYGVFVHFGLYSIIGQGEWYLDKNPNANKEEYEKLPAQFNVDPDWAKDIVSSAKNSGAKYITITTRHHEGFSLYDTCGLNTYDAPHSKCHRDLIKEFVSECNAQGIKPFFYHTLLDWHEPTYTQDFDKYLDYLYNSVELLCTNYGEIGGFWFDGWWDKKDADWKFDRLYNMVKKHQPNAMIINNTGLDNLGKVSHPLIDSVTFERGNPSFVDNSDRPRAGEMCESITDHWGYAKDDISFKPVSSLIDTLMICRKFNSNFLLNVGPQANGKFGDYEKQTLDYLGKWIKTNKDFIYKARKTDIDADNADILYDESHYYAVISDVPMETNVKKDDPNALKTINIKTDKKVVNAIYLDNNKAPEVSDNKFKLNPFPYGTSLHTRIVQFDLE
ncbi:MAG: alpha-L-fucosidase [Coriobacteriia bacterium]|nr:alpha-L-fucosidase [Coriobacteriia bacterium]